MGGGGGWCGEVGGVRVRGWGRDERMGHRYIVDDIDEEGHNEQRWRGEGRECVRV